MSDYYRCDCGNPECSVSQVLRADCPEGAKPTPTEPVPAYSGRAVIRQEIAAAFLRFSQLTGIQTGEAAAQVAYELKAKRDLEGRG